jgi:tetratricopeptide (TPR) repeat protein
VSAGVPQPSARWVQLEGRIESSYFQQNAPGLEALAATLPDDPSEGRSDNGSEKWRNYYAALVAYRLALLAKDNADRAWLAAQRCTDRLNHVLVLDTASAEALALQSACLALQSRLDPWRSPLAAPLSLARIDKALTLAPQNPRVLLLGALASRDRPRFFGGDTGQAFSLLRLSVSAFERQRGHAQGMPGWGAADAFTDLARDYLARGDSVAARNVLERALLLAPDFGPARRLMAQIVSG